VGRELPKLSSQIITLLLILRGCVHWDHIEPQHFQEKTGTAQQVLEGHQAIAGANRSFPMLRSVAVAASRVIQISHNSHNSHNFHNFRTITKMAVTSASDVPSLSLLYKLKKLEAAKLGPVEGASPEFNDKIGFFVGDITSLAVGAIVNAANQSLLGGGGVDGAIHRAAGPGLVEECEALRDDALPPGVRCATGSSKITGAHDLPCERVIHTVGPVYFRAGPERSEKLLRRCYESSLALAAAEHLKSVAFCGIGTGIYGYPALDAAAVACDAVREHLATDAGQGLDKVIFVAFNAQDIDAYNATLPYV
jgi:O-acetyl-ADP-ribose deacetylase